jgi:hypothetical protein
MKEPGTFFVTWLKGLILYTMMFIKKNYFIMVYTEQLVILLDLTEQRGNKELQYCTKG